MENGISIIVPAFNGLRILRNTLAGFLVQEHFDQHFELIIVDNGSLEDLSQLVCNFESHFPIKIIKRCLINHHFRPGSARNIGALCSKFNKLVFLDSDCIPSSTFLSEHWKVLSLPNREFATIGHRFFIESSQVNPDQILSSPTSLDRLDHVKSVSNYLKASDRRLPELRHLRSHPAPYNCLHGCNFGVNKADFFNVSMFDLKFDGCWGYEDIELGYRLFMRGVEFVYLEGAFVYHQEGGALSLEERLVGKERNFRLACKKIPDFAAFRRTLGR